MPFWLSHRDRLNRAGANTGAAAGAALLIKYRQGYAAGPQREADCARCALIAADTAFDTLAGKAGLVDGGEGLPRRLLPASLQGASGAVRGAVAAECAFASGEINARIARIATDDDVRWAGINTVAAACARLQKISFGKCPGRAKWSLAKREVATQKVAAAVGSGHR